MWDKQKTDIFNKIKAINPNARASFYENKTVAEMLKILKSYESKNNKSKSLNKSKKKDNISNKILKNKDYDTDESTESKFQKGLEYYYDLEDVDNKSFDVIEKQEENLITEGIHLIAHVRDKQSGEAVTIEDNDYNSKQQFENDLKSNGYVNISILDNRDLYLMDNSDFTKISQVKKKLRELKRDIEEYDEEKYPSLHKQAVDDYNNLKELYDKAMKVSLTEGYVLKGIDNGKSFDIAYDDNEEKLNKFKDELQNSHKNIDMYIIKESFNYVNKEDEPKLNDYIGLSMQIDGTKTKIKTLKAKINKDKYDVDKNKHKYQLNYYEQLLAKYEDAIKDIKKLKEDLNNNIILYHGSSNTSLTNLDIGKSEGNGDQLGKGIYLTTDYNEAQSYAGSNGKVYKVQLEDNLKLFNLNDKLSDSIKQQLNKELNSSNNKDVKNYICMFNRKTYEVKDKQEGLKFYQDKQKEWEQLDNKYFGNKPKVIKKGNNLQVIYTDYSDIQAAINNMTGENLLDTLRGDIDPTVFVTVITDSGYDGVITHNDKWYVIYKDINKVHLLNESKQLQGNKLEEVSRNDMLVKAKKQTITRYNKAAGYRGFSIIDIDTTSVLTTNCLRVTCKVGDYWDTVEMQNILYWIQAEAEKNRNYQVNTKGVTAAIMNSIDGMDIKVDCTCPDFKYRFAYLATKLGYKYGKPENRPAKITNPNDYGAICKHLISMLGNKKWLQQVTGTLMDFIVKRIDDVNKFLRVRPGEELTLPNELARQNAKLGFYSKLFKDKEDEVGDQGEENENQKDTTDSKTNTKDTIKDNNSNNNTNDIRSNNIKNINQDKGDEN